MNGATWRCPCNSGDTYAGCCGRFIDAGSFPPTAEALMRSRFTAFATGNASYLLKTWHPDTRPGTLELDGSQQWVRLDIRGITDGGPWDTEGVVSFTAHYRREGTRGSQAETSRFTRIGRQWLYVDALTLA
ncbi:YchJ family protein [Arthrobacter silviterrae]|uniref:YchJ family protein n=1 Tax=Arthrobacter silviterrae TaxID=2026658 RepID=UPI0021CD7F3F|nr:hypothetical protein [Arthrobacter sp. A2-55]